ncbi:MAG: hypothetical protein AABZ74_16950 [Cyanobacteriota bacterium]
MYDFVQKILREIEILYPKKNTSVISSKYTLYVSKRNFKELINIKDTLEKTIYSYFNDNGFKIASKNISFDIIEKNSLSSDSFVVLNNEKIQNRYNLFYKQIENNKIIYQDEITIFSDENTFNIGRNEKSNGIIFDSKSLKLPEDTISRVHVELQLAKNIIDCIIFSSNGSIIFDYKGEKETKMIKNEIKNNILNKNFVIESSENTYYDFEVREK